MIDIMPENHSVTRIKKLSPLLINQLAAGEVVTRPAAVVKELLENAIDAGATHIEVRITQGGMGMIEVVDNGSGIHPDDMVMAVTRHATSKVADIATLQGINTLGFRGEALSAMAAVSRLTLISSFDDSGIGRQLQVAGVLADTPKLSPVVHQQGTTVTVKDLYFNVPARRSNLKSIGTEFAHIETIVREVALARADITLNLYHDNKKRLLLSASLAETNADINNSRLPLSRLEQALSMTLSANAIPLIIDLSSLLQSSAESTATLSQVSGWLWVNHLPQPALPKLLYVNGRLIKEPLISNQLRQLASHGQFDSIGYALYFDLPAQWLNVNVHPTKQRIKISPLNNIMAHLGHAVGLKLKSLSPNIDNIVESDSKSPIDVEKNTNNRASGVGLKELDRNNTYPNQRTNKEISYKNDEVNHSNQNGRSRQQVAAPQTPYQRFASQDLAINYAKSNRKTSSFIDNKITLPHCLDVLNSLPDHCSSPISSDSYIPSNSHISSDKGNVCLEQGLLFYSQGHCLIIKQKDWQSIWQTVCDDKLTFITQSTPSYLAEQSLTLKSVEPIDALIINQQVSHYAHQLPTPHLSEFAASLEQALKTYAFASLNTEQLLNVMLSSPSQ